MPSVSLWGGLQAEIGFVVKMFKPETLYDAYHLARMQEATKGVMNKRYTPILATSKSSIPNGSITNQISSTYTRPQTTLALPATPYNKIVSTTNEQPKRQLSKEFAEKRSKNLCFYSDQKYTPGHKCSD